MTIDNNLTTILLYASLYIFNVIVPLIVAFIFYKAFPKDKITAKGFFANFSFNTTGAFATFVITVVIFLFLTLRIANAIDGYSKTYWELTGKIKLIDNNKEMLTDLSDTVIEVNPPLADMTGNTFKILLKGTDEQINSTMIKFKIAKFGTETYTVDLSDKNSYTRDTNNRIIKLVNPIIVRKHNFELNEFESTTKEKIKAISMDNTNDMKYIIDNIDSTRDKR